LSANLTVEQDAWSELFLAHAMLRRLTSMLFFCSALVLAQLSHAVAFDHNHKGLSDVLQSTVAWNKAGTATQVNYAALKAAPAALNTYTQSLSAVTAQEFAGFSKLQRRAFLINAYNAFTLQLILTKYPNLKSIKDLGSLFKSPWKQTFFTLLGQKTALDDIEHTLLRGASDYDDPRIHFAVNCASIGCPALRPEAYVASRLDQQLFDQTQRFLRDRTRNHYDAASSTLFLSSIFDWYGDDFNRGFLGAPSLAAFLAGYGGSLGLSNTQLAQLKRGEVEFDFGDYDWQLNDHR
jgi:hypothetical protein